MSEQSLQLPDYAPPPPPPRPARPPISTGSVIDCPKPDRPSKPPRHLPRNTDSGPSSPLSQTPSRLPESEPTITNEVQAPEVLSPVASNALLPSPSIQNVTIEHNATPASNDASMASAVVGDYESEPLAKFDTSNKSAPAVTISSPPDTSNIVPDNPASADLNLNSLAINSSEDSSTSSKYAPVVITNSSSNVPSPKRNASITMLPSSTTITVPKRSGSITCTTTTSSSGAIQGPLQKCNREGVKVTYMFSLSMEALSYTEDTVYNLNPRVRTIPLTSMIVRDSDPTQDESPELCFRVLSTIKSFVVYAPNSEIKANWLKDISTCCRVAQMKALGKELTEVGLQPVSATSQAHDNVNYTVQRRTTGFASMQGTLQKYNRDGVKVSHVFSLSPDALTYTEEPSMFSVARGRTPHVRSIPLVSMVVRDADPAHDESPELCFRVLSKTKSFVVYAPTVDAKANWLKDIAACCRVVQTKALGKELSEEDMLPVRTAKSQAINCQVCEVPFGILSQRHHCKNCGKSLCVNCSREKVRIPRIDESALFKVCLECARELKKTRKYGVEANYLTPR